MLCLTADDLPRSATVVSTEYSYSGDSADDEDNDDDNDDDEEDQATDEANSQPPGH